jgi:MFS family permease
LRRLIVNWFMTNGLNSQSRLSRSRQLLQNLRASQLDAAAFGVMVGLGETYLPLFVLTVGLGEVMSGLVASVPVLLGGIMQMISPRAVAALGSHKRWVLCCAALQAASFVPLIVAAVIGTIPAWGALTVAAVYWAGLQGTGPAWNVWIETLIPRTVRAHFFARRTRLQQAMVLAGFLGGGFALQAGKRHDRALLVFAMLFTIACVCRIASLYFLASQSEPHPLPPGRRRVPIFEQLQRYRFSNGGRLLLYIVTVQFGVWITGPYFAPYMKRKLEFSYVDYSVLIAFSFVSKILALPMCGRLAKRWGARRLLTWGGIGIVPLAVMWNVSDSYVWLCGTQVLAGLCWAAYELAFFLLFFESIPAEERVSVLTFFNLLNSAALAAGSLLGGAILHFAEEARWGYELLFAISSAWRGLALLVLWRVPQFDVVADTVGMQIREVSATGEAMDGPILSSLPDELPPPTQ